MFKGLFGRKKPVEDQVFTLEFNDALARYTGAPVGEIMLTLKDGDGNVVPPSVAMPGVYEEWKQIIAAPDRRGVIFKALDKMLFKQNSIEQNIERYVIDRFPLQGLKFCIDNAKEEDYQRPAFLASLAKCYFFLANYEKSLEVAQSALALDEENKKAQIVLADTLHITNRHDEAHQVYAHILENSSLKNWEKESISVFDVVCYRNDLLHSSVYAVGLLSDEGVDASVWDKVSDEFYHCPYFRSQHAYRMLKQGDNLKGMAKLIALTQEYPFFRDAVMNTKSGILQFREQLKAGDLWEEELTYLNSIIRDNEWEQD